jgi:hypothetical protein
MSFNIISHNASSLVKDAQCTHMWGPNSDVFNQSQADMILKQATHPKRSNILVMCHSWFPYFRISKTAICIRSLKCLVKFPSIVPLSSATLPQTRANILFLMFCFQIVKIKIWQSLQWLTSLMFYLRKNVHRTIIGKLSKWWANAWTKVPV